MKLVVGLLLGVSLMFAMVDINKADVKELSSLKGVGKGKAVKIVEYRKANGCFKDIQDVTKVKGIGKGIVKKNQKMILITPCK